MMLQRDYASTDSCCIILPKRCRHHIVGNPNAQVEKIFWAQMVESVSQLVFFQELRDG